MSDFDVNSLTENERVAYERLLAGEVADFRNPDAEIILRSAFLHWLSLHSSSLSRGIRIRGARIDGDVDLSCVALPSLMLEDCDIPGHVDVSNAHLGALSLDRSRLYHVFARGASIDGPFDFSDVRPFATEAWIDASKAFVRGGIMGVRARLKTPAKRPKEQISVWDKVYAVRLSEAEIRGNVWLADHFIAEGGVCLDETHITGTFSMARDSLVTAAEDDLYHPGDSFHAYAARIDGMMALNFGFRSQGRIFIINSKFGSRFNVDGVMKGTRPGYDFKGRIMNVNASLMIEHCEIGTSLGLYGCSFDCGVSLSHTKIGNGVSFARTTITNKSEDGKAPALTIEQSHIGEDLVFGSQFSAEGEVSISRSHIIGDVDLTGARLDNAAGLALNARRARIEGEVRPHDLPSGSTDRLNAAGELDFTGARIG